VVVDRGLPCRAARSGRATVSDSREHSTPITFPEDETFDIGSDTRTGVAMFEYRYDSPFKFTGKIDRLTFELGSDQSAEQK
jgi:arylsulfatase